MKKIGHQQLRTLIEKEIRENELDDQDNFDVEEVLLNAFEVYIIENELEIVRNMVVQINDEYRDDPDSMSIFDEVNPTETAKALISVMHAGDSALRQVFVHAIKILQKKTR